MRIKGSELRKIIKEEVRRAALREADDLGAGSEVGVVAGDTSGALDAVGSYLEKIKDRAGSAVSTLVGPMASILQGTKIITAENAGTDDALLVNTVLGAYARAHPEDSEFADAFTMTLPTKYNKAAVRLAQAATGASPDGKFGRQTLVSVITDGSLLISPSNAERLKNDPNYAKKIAMKSLLLMVMRLTPAGTGYKEAIEPSS